MVSCIVITDDKLAVVAVYGPWQTAFPFDGPCYANMLEDFTDKARDRLLSLTRQLLDGEIELVHENIDLPEDTHQVSATRRDGGGLFISHTIKARLQSDLQQANGTDELLEFVVASTDDWFWETDREHRFTKIIGNITSSSTLQSGDFIGHRREDNALDLDDREKWTRYRRTLRSRKPFHDFVLKTRNPVSPLGFSYIRTSGTPLFDGQNNFLGYRGLAREITRERVLDEHLREALDAMEEGIAIWDEADRLVLYNDRYKMIYPQIRDALQPGITFAELIRKAADAGTYTVADHEIEEFIAERLSRHRNPQGTIIQKIANDRYVRISERPTLSGGTVTSWLDITELKRHENDLATAQMDAEAANRSKDRFLQNMSHELRTPLNAIIGFAELVLAEPNGPIGHKNYENYLRHIELSGQNLLQIIAQILDYVDAAGAGARLTEDRIRIGDLLSLCTNQVDRETGKGSQQIYVETGYQSCADDILIADASKLQVAIGGLISNVVKFASDSGWLGLAARYNGDGELCITVADHGGGMTDPEIQTALSSFEQIEPHLQKRTAGIGLGLPLAHRIVELHGGRMEIISKIGRGTSVSIYLPAGRIIKTNDFPVSATIAEAPIHH